jgi:hypothetical protein
MKLRVLYALFSTYYSTFFSLNKAIYSISNSKNETVQYFPDLNVSVIILNLILQLKLKVQIHIQYLKENIHVLIV